MSAANWQENQDLRADNARLLTIIASMERHAEFMKQVLSGVRRKTFKKNHPREFGIKGRALVNCRGCKKYLPQRAHRLCDVCYMSWWYQKTKHKKVGGKRLDYDEYKQIMEAAGSRAVMNKQRWADALAVGSLRRKGYLPDNIE